MDAAFLTPAEATAAGVPKSSANRHKDSMAKAVEGRVLVVDGALITTPEAITGRLLSLSSRADAAERELAAATDRAARLDQELQLVRHELDVQRDRAAAMSPKLAAIAAAASQLLNESLNAPESQLPD